MVDGVHGHKDRAVRLVVMEQGILLEHVAIHYHRVEVYHVMAVIHLKKPVLKLVAKVRMLIFCLIHAKYFIVVMF